jgi:hypothetical protein
VNVAVETTLTVTAARRNAPAVAWILDGRLRA